jgi:hypothetical protein
VLLFTGNFPGLPGQFTTDVQLDGHEYYSDSYEIPSPAIGNNTTSPSAVAFHNVTFWLWMTGWHSALGSYVHGNGTEANGTLYSFLLGGSSRNAMQTAVYISPDAKFAAAWSGGFFLELLVEV